MLFIVINGVFAFLFLTSLLYLVSSYCLRFVRINAKKYLRKVMECTKNIHKVDILYQIVY